MALEPVAHHGSMFRIRELLNRQRTQAINALRGHLTEFGQIVPQGADHLQIPGPPIWTRQGAGGTVRIRGHNRPEAPILTPTGKNFPPRKEPAAVQKLARPNTKLARRSSPARLCQSQSPLIFCPQISSGGE